MGSIQNLRNSFQPILSKILLALDAPPIFVRTKALRALGQIVTSDATILSTVSILNQTLPLFKSSRGQCAPIDRGPLAGQLSSGPRCSCRVDWEVHGRSSRGCGRLLPEDCRPHRSEYLSSTREYRSPVIGHGPQRSEKSHQAAQVLLRRSQRHESPS